ncbi:multi-sensor hybrid histidine kinase [mine drainage metagenome]|uniref:histidine kinase n=1 Tax=mine drainage metagenome TaxID=410659 RepID=T1ARP2_9ZZZZ
MDGGLTVSKVVSEMLEIANSSLPSSALLSKFIETVKGTFRVDDVKALSLSNEQAGQLDEYVSNTKKPYIDNQLSEYSAFPELIQYKNAGYSSCAVIPVSANGKVVLTFKVLSKEENKFNEELVGMLSLVSSIFSFSFAYKEELGKNIRLAEYFDAAFFSSPVPQFILSKDNRIVRENKESSKALRLTGMNLKDALGVDYEALKAAASYGKAITKPLKASGTRNLYSLSPTKLGDSLLHVAATNITGKHLYGGMMGAFGVSEHVYAALIDKDYSVVSYSPNLESAFSGIGGIDKENKFNDILDEKSMLALSSAIDRCVDKPVLADIRLTLEGGQVPMHAVIARTDIGYIIVASDMEAEEYARKATQDMDDFVEGISEVALKVDDQGFIKECNIPVESVLGYAKEELVGRQLSSIYKDSAILSRDVSYVYNGGKVDNSYIDLIRKDGTSIAATQTIRKFRSMENKEGYIVIFKELETKRRMDDLESQLREKDAEARRLKSTSDLKSQFIDNISHELKTPLTSIRGYSLLLYEGQGGELNDSEKDWLHTIIEESDRLMLIIQQVLDASKLEANKIKLELKDVDLRAMGGNPSIKGLEEMARGKGLEFEWKVDYNVPNITADPNRVIQVFAT